MHPGLKAEIFALLEAKILAGNHATGRRGLDLWQILVLGVVRLGLDADWDRMEHVANYDTLVRQMLGVPAAPWGQDDKTFARQTLRDNVALLDDAPLQQINARIATAGRELFAKKAAQTERESGKRFTGLRRQHSAVESKSNSLEHHGLNRCPEAGMKGYRRDVCYGVMSYHLHVIGRALLARHRANGPTLSLEACQVRQERCRRGRRFQRIWRKGRRKKRPHFARPPSSTQQSVSKTRVSGRTLKSTQQRIACEINP